MDYEEILKISSLTSICNIINIQASKAQTHFYGDGDETNNDYQGNNGYEIGRIIGCEVVEKLIYIIIIGNLSRHIEGAAKPIKSI